MTVKVSKSFVDFDNQLVEAGTYEGAEIVRRGYAEGRANWFWNIVQNNRVLAVTVGYPPKSHAVKGGV